MSAPTDTKIDPVRGGRRGFLQALAVLGVGGQTLLQSGSVKAAVEEVRGTFGQVGEWPEMARRTLGRTGFEASRLVFGCGASLARQGARSAVEYRL